MSKIDLEHIWDSDREKARRHYDSLDDVEGLAKRQSRSVLNKIHRNIWMETIFSVLLIVVLTYSIYTWDSGLPFWIFSGFFAFIIYLSVRVYLRFARDLHRAHQQGVAEALRRYVRVVGHYIRRQKVLVWYVTPLGYLVGLVVASLAEPKTQTFVEILKQIGLGALIGLPLLVLIIWFFSKKYLKWVYVPHYESLKQILQHLEQEEENTDSPGSP